MIQKILILACIMGYIFLCGNSATALLNRKNVNSTLFTQYLTLEEQKNIPLLIALSLKELCSKNSNFSSFIEGLKIADSEKTNHYQESPEIQAYAQYAIQVSLDPKITKNLDLSEKYLQKKQSTEGVIPLIIDRIYYKTLKASTEPGIEDNTINRVKINFSIRDIENNLLAGTYTLSGPLACTLSELIPGMAHGMLGMSLNEIREIYIHPEFAYGVFSDFGNGRAITVQVELIECSSTDLVFQPCLISADLVKLLQQPPKEANIACLEKDLTTFCGKASWLFYKQKLPQLQLGDLLQLLQSDTVLSSEDKETLHKLQWLMYTL